MFSINAPTPVMNGWKLPGRIAPPNVKFHEGQSMDTMDATMAGERFRLAGALTPELESAFYSAASRLAAGEIERLYICGLIDRVRRGDLSVYSLLCGGEVAGAICYRSVDGEAELIHGFVAPEHEGAEGVFLGMVTEALARSGTRVIRSGFGWPGQARFSGAAAAAGFAAVSRISMARDVAEGEMFSFVPSPGVSVTPWSAADFEDVSRLMHEASAPADRRVYPLFASPEGSRALLLSIVQGRHGAFEPGLSAVAEVRGETAGFLLSSLMPDGGVLVLDVAVKEGLRRKGIASHMIRYLISRCAAAGRRQIVLAVTAENVEAIGLYKKMGFREIAAFEQHVLMIEKP